MHDENSSSVAPVDYAKKAQTKEKYMLTFFLFLLWNAQAFILERCGDPRELPKSPADGANGDFLCLIHSNCSRIDLYTFERNNDSAVVRCRRRVQIIYYLKYFPFTRDKLVGNRRLIGPDETFKIRHVVILNAFSSV